MFLYCSSAFFGPARLAAAGATPCAFTPSITTAATASNVIVPTSTTSVRFLFICLLGKKCRNIVLSLPCLSRLIAVHTLAGKLGDNELRRQEPVDFCFQLRGHKQEYPPAPGPVALQIGIGQIDFGRICKGRTEPHRSRSSLHQINGPPQIKQQR